MNSMGRCVNECGRGRRRAYGVEEHAAKREGTQLSDYWVGHRAKHTAHTKTRGTRNNKARGARGGSGA